MRQLLDKQNSEVDRLTLSYTDVVEAHYEHTNVIIYDQLESGAKSAYTRKLNGINEEREETMTQWEKAKRDRK